jgi:DNA-binding NtrC family response regulator
MLSRLGYEVATRSSSLEALEAFRANPDHYDLVITDQTMPQMTGDTMAHHMHATRPDMPIILVTGFSETVTARNYRQLGFRGYLMKPLIFRDLACLVRAVLEEAEMESI